MGTEGASWKIGKAKGSGETPGRDKLRSLPDFPTKNPTCNQKPWPDIGEFWRPQALPLPLWMPGLRSGLLVRK